ncbi:MAG: hypothetical protein B7Z72_00425 [Gemmatimonadetes bacterium 21-71-4]|nr:MAG: hypothetical protein B7Z72_00425 [Gemmatimonadetes bacterium 21-71-4]
MNAEPAPIVFDLRAAALLVARRWRRVALGVALGAVAAAGILLFVRPRFDGHALLLIRQFPEAGGQIQSKMNLVSQLAPGLLGGDADQELATELALLQSRSALGVVVDSLRLQVHPRSPGRVPPASLVDSLALPDRFAPVKFTLVAGANTRSQGTLYASKAGAGAYVRLVDRENAIDDLLRRLSVVKVGGDVVQITYAARDSITAAQVPNLIAQVYMQRRKTVDRGLNQRRLEFLAARADTVRRDLRRAVDSLARLQQESGAGVSAEISAKGMADQLATVQAQLAQLRASYGALDSLIFAARPAAAHARPRGAGGQAEGRPHAAVGTRRRHGRAGAAGAAGRDARGRRRARGGPGGVAAPGDLSAAAAHLARGPGRRAAAGADSGAGGRRIGGRGRNTELTERVVKV